MNTRLYLFHLLYQDSENSSKNNRVQNSIQNILQKNNRLIEMYDLPAVSIISPQTEGILFRTPLDTRLAFPSYSSLVEHSKDRAAYYYVPVRKTECQLRSNWHATETLAVDSPARI